MGAKIKSIERFTTHYKLLNFSGTPEVSGEYKSSVMTFDENENILEESKYSPYGELEEQVLNKYDDKNKLIEETINYIIDDVSEKRIILRNDKGFVVKEQKEFSDGSMDTTLFNYDEKNNISEIIKFNEDESIDTKLVVSYNDLNKPVEEKKFDGENHLLEHRVQVYDTKGNVIEVSEFSPEDGLAYRHTFEYDESGNNLFSSYYNAKGILVSKITSVHDEKGNLTEKIIEDFNSSSQTKKINYQYDDKNNCIEEAMYSGNGTLLSRLSTKFDENNNPIEELNYEVDQAHSGQDEYYGTRYSYTYF